MTTQLITILDVYTNVPVQVETDNIALACEFLRQSEAAGSAICIGKGIVENNDEPVSYYSINKLKVFRSKVDDRCSIVSSDVLMERFKENILMQIYYHVPDREFISLLNNLYRQNRKVTNLSIDFVKLVTIICDHIANCEIDFVKLSTMVYFPFIRRTPQ